MKTRVMLLSALVVTLALVSSIGWAQGKYVPDPNEKLFGTWTNRKPVGKYFHVEKEVMTAEGYEWYFHIADSATLEEGTFGIDSKWTDSEGNIWYRIFGTVRTGESKGHKWQELCKLTESAAVMESVSSLIGAGEFDPSNYPTKIDPKEPTYMIFYRAVEQ